MTKEKFNVYLRGSWDFPAKLEIKDEGVQVGTLFFSWDQLDVFIKMLKAAKACRKLGV